VGCKTGGDIAQAPITVDPVTKRRVVPEGSSQYADKSRSLSLMVGRCWLTLSNSR
jgi:hypothetical protein